MPSPQAFLSGAEKSFAVSLLVSCALVAALFTWRTLGRTRRRRLSRPISTGPQAQNSSTEHYEGGKGSDAVVAKESSKADGKGTTKDEPEHVHRPQRHAHTEHLEENHSHRHHHHHHHHHHEHQHTHHSHRDSSRTSSNSSESSSRSDSKAKRPHRAKTDVSDDSTSHRHHHTQHEDSDGRHHHHHRGRTEHGSVLVDRSHHEHESRILPFDSTLSFCSVSVVSDELSERLFRA